MIRSLRISLGIVFAGAVITAVLPLQMAGATVKGPALNWGVSGAHSAALPHTRIKGSSGDFVFTPTSLNAAWSGPTQKTCTTNRQQIMIINKTDKRQKLTYLGKVVGTLPAGEEGGICFWGTQSEQFVFGLNKSTAQLTVSVS